MYKLGNSMQERIKVSDKNWGYRVSVRNSHNSQLLIGAALTFLRQSGGLLMVLVDFT